MAMAKELLINNALHILSKEGKEKGYSHLKGVSGKRMETLLEMTHEKYIILLLCLLYIFIDSFRRKRNEHRESWNTCKIMRIYIITYYSQLVSWTLFKKHLEKTTWL